MATQFCTQVAVVPVSLPVAGLPAPTMWPATKSLPQAPEQVLSDWTGRVAVRSVCGMSSLVELWPQP